MNRARFTVVRDTLTWIGGWLIVAKQAGIGFPPPVVGNDMLILLAASLIGTPGLASLLALYRTGTTGSPSSSPASESSPSSSGEP